MLRKGQTCLLKNTSQCVASAPRERYRFAQPPAHIFEALPSKLTMDHDISPKTTHILDLKPGGRKLALVYEEQRKERQQGKAF